MRVHEAIVSKRREANVLRYKNKASSLPETWCVMVRIVRPQSTFVQEAVVMDSLESKIVVIGPPGS